VSHAARLERLSERLEALGVDALLVTNDERVVKGFGLSRDELSKTTPLFQHKDSVTLVIKFD